MIKVEQKNTPVTWSSFIHRGPKRTITDSNGVARTVQKKVGAVVGIRKEDSLMIGWSLCNSKTRVSLKHNQIMVTPPDRFSPEIALSLAEGRALKADQFDTSPRWIANQSPPSVEHLVRMGVPQSAISAISEVVRAAIHSSPGINTIVIFSTKSERVPKAQKPAW